MKRTPTFSVSLPENGETMMNKSAIGMSAIPAMVAPRPRTLCQVRGSRKITPYIPKVMAIVATDAAVKGFDANNSSGTSAARPMPFSVKMKAEMQATAMTHATSAGHTLVCASMAAKATAPNPRAPRICPRVSKLRLCGSADSGSVSGARAAAARLTGTTTRKMLRQSKR
jgi:hypothetical protein